MKNNEEALQQYMREVTEEFVNKYTKELDNSILQMLQQFGYEGDDPNNSGKWLEENNFQLFMDEDMEEDDRKTKSIYLVDTKTNTAVGVFMVQTWIEDGCLNYRFSDVFVNQDFLDE